MPARSEYARRRLAELNGNENAVASINQTKRKHAAAGKELIMQVSKYEQSKLPIACDNKGAPSIVAELGAYCGTDEGMQLLRKGIRALLVNFAFGDKASAKLLFGTAPNIQQVNIDGLLGHIVVQGEKSKNLSPAEMRKQIAEGNIIDVEGQDVLDGSTNGD